MPVPDQDTPHRPWPCPVCPGRTWPESPSPEKVICQVCQELWALLALPCWGGSGTLCRSRPRRHPSLRALLGLDLTRGGGGLGGLPQGSLIALCPSLGTGSWPDPGLRPGACRRPPLTRRKQPMWHQHVLSSSGQVSRYGRSGARPGQVSSSCTCLLPAEHHRDWFCGLTPRTVSRGCSRVCACVCVVTCVCVHYVCVCTCVQLCSASCAEGQEPRFLSE